MPKITKTLLSISKLTHDNNVIVEFDSKSYLVKDKESKTIILQGSLRNDLYQLSVPVKFKFLACHSELSTKCSNFNTSACNFQFSELEISVLHSVKIDNMI